MKYYTTTFNNNKELLEKDGLKSGSEGAGYVEVYSLPLMARNHRHPIDELLVELELEDEDVIPVVDSKVVLVKRNIPPSKIKICKLDKGKLV